MTPSPAAGSSGEGVDGHPGGSCGSSEGDLTVHEELVAAIQGYEEMIWEYAAAKGARCTDRVSGDLQLAASFMSTVFATQPMEPYLQAVQELVLENLLTGRPMGMAKLREVLEPMEAAHSAVYSAELTLRRLHWYHVLGALVFMNNPQDKDGWTDIYPVVRKRPDVVNVSVQSIPEMCDAFADLLQDLQTYEYMQAQFALALLVAVAMAAMPSPSDQVIEMLSVAYIKYVQ